MSVLRSVLRLAAPLPKVEQYERFLFLGPHPDDIEIGAGAAATGRASGGERVCQYV